MIWRTTTVNRIVKNKVYIGVQHHKFHEPDPSNPLPSRKRKNRVLLTEFDVQTPHTRIIDDELFRFNVKVGGAYASQHILGEAADIVPPYKQRQTPYTLKAWFDWLKDNINFDQLILEYDSKGSYWIHVSCRRNRKANRHLVFYDLKK